MGLFDKFMGGQTSEAVRLNPPEAFASLVLAVIGADGNISDELALKIIEAMSIKNRG